MPGGHPTDLTPEVLEQVKRLLPTVLYIETVADYIGISRRSVCNWMKWGSQEQKRLDKNKRAKPLKSEVLYLEFFRAVKKALAEGEFQDAQVIKNASAKQWTAAAWRLERRFPERWSSFRGEMADIARREQENRNEIAQLRAALGPANPTGTGPAQGNTGPASGGSGDSGSD